MDLIVLVRVDRSLRFGSLLGSGDLLVQSDQNLSEPEASSNSDTKHGNDDTVGLSEAVLGHLPDIGPGDVAELREGIDHCNCDRSLCRRSGKARRNPRIEHYEACVGAGLEEESDVSSGHHFSRDTNDKSYEAEEDWADNVPELIVSTVLPP